MKRQAYTRFPPQALKAIAGSVQMPQALDLLLGWMVGVTGIEPVTPTMSRNPRAQESAEIRRFPLR